MYRIGLPAWYLRPSVSHHHYLYLSSYIGFQLNIELIFNWLLLHTALFLPNNRHIVNLLQFSDISHVRVCITYCCIKEIKCIHTHTHTYKVSSYIAQYPVLGTVQSDFTIYFPVRPVQSNTVSISLGSIPLYATINARRLLVQVFIYTAE